MLNCRSGLAREKAHAKAFAGKPAPTISSCSIRAESIEGKGFVLDHSTGSHRVYYHAATGRRAVVPFHSGDLPIGTMMAILKGAGIPREDWTH
jgi:predicted RNA binding protein YcfA (HicA-like mRNA interferase family)